MRLVFQILLLLLFLAACQNFEPDKHRELDCGIYRISAAEAFKNAIKEWKHFEEKSDINRENYAIYQKPGLLLLFPKGWLVDESPDGIAAAFIDNRPAIDYRQNFQNHFMVIQEPFDKSLEAYKSLAKSMMSRPNVRQITDTILFINDQEAGLLEYEIDWGNGLMVYAKQVIFKMQQKITMLTVMINLREKKKYSDAIHAFVEGMDTGN